MLVVQVLEELMIKCCLDKTDMNVELVLVIWCCVRPIGWRILVRCLAMLWVGEPLDTTTVLEGSIKIVYLGLSKETRAGDSESSRMQIKVMLNCLSLTQL